MQVRYADGRRANRREAKGASIKLAGREDTFTAVIEPKREDIVSPTGSLQYAV